MTAHTIPGLAKWAGVSEQYVNGLIGLGALDAPDEGATYSDHLSRKVVTDLKVRRHRLVNDTNERHLRINDQIIYTHIRSGS